MELFSSGRVPPITNRMRMKAPCSLQTSAATPELSSDGGREADGRDPGRGGGSLAKAS